jgi:hypothetical protein
MWLHTAMIKRLGILLLLTPFLLAVSGCYSTQEGRLKAGVPFSKDTISSRYELPFARVYEAAKSVIVKNGTLTNDDQVTRVLRGVVDGRSVWIKLDDSEPRLTTITIQARTKGGGADVDLASELDKQIYGELILKQ